MSMHMFGERTIGLLLLVLLRYFPNISVAGHRFSSTIEEHTGVVHGTTINVYRMKNDRSQDQ